MLAELAALPLEERRRVPGLHPDRAPTIVAGGLILIETMRLFGLDSVEVSEHDILEGAALRSGRRSAANPEAKNVPESRLDAKAQSAANIGLNVHFGRFLVAVRPAPGT